jgi:iron complex outermembrane receptor protein
MNHVAPLTRTLPLWLLIGASYAQEATPKPDAKIEELPELVISAPKLGLDLLNLPVSATVADSSFLEQAAVRNVKDAAIYAPNTFFTEFSARKLSNPKFRGIGASPTNPGVTTYLDGVPQFNANSSSLTLLDVEQIDFVRGPVGALFGRNSVGGLINITSRRPSLDTWHGSLETTHGNYGLHDYRGSVTGPLIKDQLGFSFAGGYNEREGFTKDTISSRDIDHRSAWFGKTQFLWTPNKDLEVRLTIAGETADDGDYALSDLAQLRNNTFRSSRNFLGYTKRDLAMPTLQITYHADAFDFTSITGFVWWKTEDFTDLDYSAGLPPALALLAPPGSAIVDGSPSFLARNNREEQRTWTQEFRFASRKEDPIVLGSAATLAWQSGLFFFHQNYEQSIAQNRAHVALGPNPPFGVFASVFPGEVKTNRSTLTDAGVGIYLQSTLTLWDKLDITAGGRWDHEEKDADLATATSTTSFAAPAAIPPPNVVNATTSQRFSRSLDGFTPQAAISYKITPDILTYFSFAGGYKAGGFNAASPAGSENYEEEHNWNYEVGIKGRALKDSLSFSLAAFYTDWQNLQLNVPYGGPAQFQIANAGDATSKGIELALAWRPARNWDIFGSAGWQDARFNGGSMDNNSLLGFGGTRVGIGGNQVPFTPDYTTSIGTQYTWELPRGFHLYARADVQFIGSYNYDTVNGAAQDAYTLANFRVGVRGKKWFSEVFANNAFNTNYVPMAIQFPGSASGYIGEMGAPLTVGVRAGIKF